METTDQMSLKANLKKYKNLRKKNLKQKNGSNRMKKGIIDYINNK